MSGWSEESITELKRYHALGFSASKIALTMGEGRTRNAIIGRLHRCGLTQPKQPGKPQMSKQVPRAPRASPARVHPFSVPKARIGFELDERPLQAADIVPLNISLLDLRPGQCKWPYGDRVPFLFCGHDTVIGLPYCRPHCRLSYAPRPRGDNRGRVA